MAAVVKWLLRRRDQCSVSYSRFGMPGDAAEDRPPPTSIIISAFDENNPDFLFFNSCHSQKAAVAAAGFGMSFVILMFISAFFEFDWYHHKRGIDIVAVLSLLFYVVFGVLIHYYVIVGIKRQAAHYLLPFIVVYSVVIGGEAIMIVYQLTHMSGSVLFNVGEERRQVMLFSVFMMGVVLFVQANMLTAVARCRLYLSRKHLHSIAMKVAQKSRSRNSGLQIVVASRGSAAASAATAVPSPCAGERHDSAPRYDGAEPPPYSNSDAELGDASFVDPKSVHTERTPQQF